MKLEAEENCCVCYEAMKEGENLTYCKIGCGRNLHTDCIEVWVKHKVSVAQKITCPVSPRSCLKHLQLCRTDWGPNALDDLKEETKQYREKKIEENKKKAEANERQFKCYCCKRTLIYEAKLQCIVCPVSYETC